MTRDELIAEVEVLAHHTDVDREWFLCFEFKERHAALTARDKVRRIVASVGQRNDSAANGIAELPRPDIFIFRDAGKTLLVRLGCEEYVRAVCSEVGTPKANCIVRRGEVLNVL